MTISEFFRQLPIWGWAALGVAAALIIVAIVCIILICRLKSKRKKSKTETVNELPVTTDTEPEENLSVSMVPEPLEEQAPVQFQSSSESEEESGGDGEEEEEGETVLQFKDGYGILIRYNKSFTARLIQSPDDAKNRYTALKNELLSYKNVKSRISWNFDSFNSGRNKLAKLNVHGKTLKLYLALNPDDYVDTKYKVERVETKRYEGVPCMYRISNPRRAEYAFDLIAAVAEKYGVERGETQIEDYYLPYEKTEPLLERGLIKENVTELAYEEYMRRKNQADVDEIRREFVSAAEVNAIIADDVAATLIEDKRNGKIYSGKKDIINIDVLSANFNANDRVTLEALKKKGLIPKNVGYVKVLARGSLDKPLKVEMQDFSLEAVKMIALTGGRAKRV